MNAALILTALPEPTLLLDGRTIVAANAAAGTIFHVSARELENRDFATLFCEPAETIEGHLRLWCSTTQMTPASLVARLPDGSLRKFRCSGARVPGEPPRVLVRVAEAQAASRRFLALNERVTTLAREARIVASQQQWLEALLNLMPTPMLQVQVGTARVIFRNRAAIEMAIPHQILPLRRAASGEPLAGLELTWEESGLTRHALVQSDVLPAMHGRPATVVMTFQDITRLKRIEQDLQQASRLKDEFLATVSHELRTPLNAVMGWTMMLRDSVLDEAGQKRAIESIERNARAQTRVVEDLLDVSRIIAGQLRLDLRPIPLEPAIEAAADAVRPSAAAKGLDLRIEVDPATGPVLADAERLQQIVWNLLSNAVKFTPARGRVVVAARRNDGVEIVVSDTGPGIDAAFLPRIFERFTQAEPSHSRAHAGLGLGLAIARHLIELHGGTIDAHSEGPGMGATFTVRLPAPSSSSA